jgi:phage-related baseplate assembly protein
VIVQAVTLVNYAVNATIYVFDGPDPTVVQDAAQAALDAYTADCHKVGRDVTLSGLYAALHQPGVQKVVISAPVADVAIDLNSASWCTGTTLSMLPSTDE